MDKTKGPVQALLCRAESPRSKGVHGLLPQTATTSNPPPQKLKKLQNGFKSGFKKMDRSRVSSSDEEEEVASSTAVKQHTLNAFLSGNSSSSGDEPISEIIITDVYRDPLDECMEAIEDLATGILRTGKLSVQGEPGDMTKLQPILMGLQPTEKELSQTLLQLMQMPFFNQMDTDDYNTQEDFLSTGHIRLGLPIDTMILFLLRSHCAKGAKQAEELINIAQSSSHAVSSPRSRVPPMPPIIFSSSLSRPHTSKRSPVSHKRTNPVDDLHRNGSYNEPLEETPGGSVPSPLSSPLEERRVSKSSGSFVSPALPTATEQDKKRSRDSSHGSIFSSSTSSSSLQDGMSEASASSLSDRVSQPRMLVKQHRIQQVYGRRKISTVLERPSLTCTSSSEFSGEEFSSFVGDRRSRKRTPDHWHMSILDNSTIVSMYGDNSYPILTWSPHLRAEFKLSSSIGLVSGMVTGIDPAKPTVTMKVNNPTSHRLSFSIRAYHQSTAFSSHVAFPAQGMHVLEPYQSWEENTEFYPKTPSENEYFVIDLLVCTLGDGKPGWNVVRKYAVMKAEKKSPPQARKPSKRHSHFQIPGSMQQKEENLCQTIAHGLQCVVKSKLDKAEIIFTQALQLPEFQRVPLKAFVYICLAVVANKRRKAGQLTSLTPVLSFESNATQLLHVCESPPGSVKMPRLVQLVKQLKKELNVPDIMKKIGKKDKQPHHHHHRDRQQQESELIGPEGGTLSHQALTLTIPPGALKSSVPVTLIKPDKKRLDAMLQSSGWDKTVTILAALHIQSNGGTDHFEEPVEVTCSLPTEPRLASPTLVRLLKSNYLRQWNDITDDTLSRVSIVGKEISITTDHTGWLAVAAVQLDPSKIVQLAMRSLSSEPIFLQFSVYGQMCADNVMQIAVFMVPCRPNEEPLHPNSRKPDLEHHSPIAFPHTIQAWPGERLRLQLKGKFSPDTSSAERDLCYECEVQGTHNRICEKWVKLTSKQGEPLSGKLIVSSCQNSTDSWENVTEILLSSRTGSLPSAPDKQ